MSLGLMIYLISISSSLKNALTGLAVAVSIATGFCIAVGFVAYHEERTEDASKLLKWGKKFLTCTVVSTTLAILIPDSKTSYLILGASTMQQIAQSPKVQETGGRMLELLNKKLSELEEADKKK